MLAWDIVYKEKRQQDYVLEECLPVGKVDGFAEAAAVHLWVEDHKEQRQEGEESLHDKGNHDGSFAPYSCNQGDSHQRLGQCECHSHHL